MEDARDLRLAKYVTASISFLLIALGGGLWPFTWWDMYSTGDYQPVSEVSRFELHVLDTAGQHHVLRPMDLYTLDDDTSGQAPGHRLIRIAVTGTPQQQAVYHPYLIRQIELVLDTKIEHIEVWKNSWQVDFGQHPPIEIERPSQTVLIDRLSAHRAD